LPVVVEVDGLAVAAEVQGVIELMQDLQLQLVLQLQ